MAASNIGWSPVNELTVRHLTADFSHLTRWSATHLASRASYILLAIVLSKKNDNAISLLNIASQLYAVGGVLSLICVMPIMEYVLYECILC